MQLIRKILKQNLNKIDATRDTILSLTENGELFVNTQTGDQLKISDVEIVDNEEALSLIAPVSNKLYLIKNPVDVKVYDGSKYISFKSSIDEMYNTLDTKITETISSLNSFREKVNETDTANTTKFNDIDQSISDLTNSLNTLIETHTNDINNLNKLVSDLSTNYSSFTNSLNDFNTRLSSDESDIIKVKESLNTFTESIDTINQNITNLSSSISETNSTVSALKINIDNNTSDITAIKQQLAVEEANVVFGVLDAEEGKIDQEVYIPAFIKDDKELYITDLTIRTDKVLEQPASFSLRYVGENEDGSLKEEEEIISVSLPAGIYKTGVLNPTENKYTNGLLRLYITNLKCELTNALIILKFEMK